MPDIEILERFLKTTVVMGLGFVAIATFIGICLWVFWHLSNHVVGVVAAVREWLPRWFGSQVDMHQSIRTHIDVGTETMKEMRTTLSETHTGVKEILTIIRRDEHE
jgi:hypothetical protein